MQIMEHVKKNVCIIFTPVAKCQIAFLAAKGAQYLPNVACTCLESAEREWTAKKMSGEYWESAKRVHRDLERVEESLSQLKRP